MLQPSRTYDKADSPKDQIRMSHEIRYALKHAPGLEDEGRESDFVEVHTDSVGNGVGIVSRRSRASTQRGDPTVVVK